jgi:hypothetical protein
MELPIYLASKALALNSATPMTISDVRLHHLHTEPISCTLLAVKAVSPGSFPFITLVGAAPPSMAMLLGIDTPNNPLVFSL